MTAINVSATSHQGDTTMNVDNHPEHEAPSHGFTRHIPALLRSLGVLAVLLSLYGFFMKGWDGGNDFIRYSMLLGHTLLLAFIGIGSGFFLKEGKGARLLLMLSLVSVVAVFSILGSFIYADYGPALNPLFINAMRWNLESTQTTIIVTAISVLVLLPLIAIAFRVLARGIGLSMFTLFTLGNLALLLPVRNPLWIGVIALAIGCYALFFSVKTSRQHIELKTREGMFVMLLQFAPLATLLIRNLWLHDAVSFLYATAFAMGFIAIRQISQLLDKSSGIRLLGEMASVALAVGSSGFLFSALTLDFNNSTALVISSLVCAAMIYDISLRACAFQDRYRTLASIAIVLPLLLNLFDINDIVFVLALITIGAGMIFIGFKQKQRTVLLGGIVLVMAGAIKLSVNVWFNFDINAWVASALLGIGAIVLASLLESRSTQLKQRFNHCRLYFSEWQA